ncbi:MAG: peptidyl-prolyl cis-trans isomerase [Lachnospiraceae bacterium]|nr:peptidyl-prolyl cis-trans isomerase [Lachnospiraceae bacterium]
MKKKYVSVLSVIMACSLLFTGCGLGKKNDKSSKKNTDKKVTSEEKTSVNTGDEDSGTEESDFSDDTIVMYIGEDNVRVSDVKVYTYFLKSKYEAFGEDIWDMKDGSSSLNSMARQELLDFILEIQVINHKAAAENVTLTADEDAEIHEKAEEYMGTISKENAEKYGITAAKLETVFSQNKIAEKMYYIYTEGAEDEVTDEKARQVSIEYIYFKTKGLSEEDANEKWVQAEKIKKKALKEKNFAEFARKYTESETIAAIVGQGSKKFGDKVIDAALSLTDNRVSSVVEGNDGCYILYCVSSNDKEATQKRKEQLIESSQKKAFKDNYQKWLSSLKIDINNSFWNSLKL